VCCVSVGRHWSCSKHRADYVLPQVPTRNTSYAHLRDGFTRALTARVQLAKTRDALSPETEFAIQSPLRKLKSLFPSAAVSKGTPLDILLTAPTGDKKHPRTLVFRDLGAVDSDWVAEQFVLAYFEGDGISPAVSTLDDAWSTGWSLRYCSAEEGHNRATKDIRDVDAHNRDRININLPSHRFSEGIGSTTGRFLKQGTLS